MRSRDFLALFAVGLAVASSTVGCDGGKETTSSAGSAGEAGTAGMAGTAGTGGSTAGSAGTGGTMMTGSGGTTTSMSGDGNDSIDTAGDLMLDAIDAVSDTLDPPDTDVDFWKFDGKKGTPMIFITDAKPDNDPLADGYLDLVITLLDSKGTQIARNDDPIPRGTQDSALRTVIPADGTYYIKVEEFCESDLATTPCPADYFGKINDNSYRLSGFTLDTKPTTVNNGVVGEPAVDNDMVVSVDPMEYVPVQGGTGYYVIDFIGSFKDANDVDVYSFTLPTAMPTKNGRDTAYFNILPAGDTGDGSTAPTGLVWIEDSMNNRVAQVDGSKLDPVDGYPIEAPLKLGDTYTLHVTNGGGFDAANPFYFVIHSLGGSNPIEMGDVNGGMNNDTIATAEVLPTNMSAGGFTGGFVAGDLTAGDTDFFELAAMPAAGDVAFGTCSAQRIGSGLRGLKMTLLDKATMMPITGATATETATAAASLKDTGVALGTTKNVILKVEATQDAMVKGTYYSCGVVFGPPPMN